jgi:ribosomal protein L11 methyltransferase
MLILCPDGFEEVETPETVELVSYTDAAGEARIRRAFGAALSRPVEAGWEYRWRVFHRPSRVGPLWIGPPWERPDADAISVVIEPGRAFGTGAHPTTRLCLDLLLALHPASLLDVGCGSGVLAIAAARLGFAPVVAIDIDAEAVGTARANADVNGVSVRVDRLDALHDALPPADVIVANLDLDTIETLAPRLACRTFVTSGYLASDQVQLYQFEPVERRELDGWAADLHRLPGERSSRIRNDLVTHPREISR